MTEDQVAAILGEIGWHVGRDEAGDNFCIFNLDGREVQVIPSVKKRADHFRVSLMPSVSTPEFSRATSTIFGRHEKFTPIIVNLDGPTKLPALGREDVVALSKAAISWAEAQNIDLGLKAYLSLPTSSKGMRPLWHLAALALAKDVARLQAYKHAFEVDDRLGFVPYIKKEMIDRALTLARGEGGNL